MIVIDFIVQGMMARAEMLVPLLVVALVLGSVPMRVAGPIVQAQRRMAERFERKLNRSNRSVGTRVYRGMIAVGMLLVPSIALGVVLARSNPLSHWAALLVLVAMLGHGLDMPHTVRLWQRARSSALPLELPGRDFLFADSHALLRYLVLEGAERVAVLVVGVSVWFVLGGITLALVYGTLSVLALVYRGPAFGWAAKGLFRVMDVLPRALTCVLMLLAALFVPGARPFAMLRARSYQAVVAGVMGVSLGGTLPGRELPWMGDGTPKLMPVHLLRLVLLEVAMVVLLMVVCAGPYLFNLLNNLY